MKILKALIATVSLLLLGFSGCGDGLGNKGIEIGDTEDFVVDLRGLSLAKELGTVYNVPVAQSALRFAKIPSFATRDEVTWTSSNKNVAEVDEKTGEISIKITNPNAPQATTMIRVQSDYDPSVYAECALTVHPIYPAVRTWNFAAGSVRVNGLVIPASTNSSTGDWTSYTSDGDLGNGAVILGSSGGASEYISQRPGEYEIDPDNPYGFGVVPNGGTRSWQYGGAGNIPTGHSYPLVRPGGMGRFIQINALFGPFKIEVDYQGNNTSGSHVDIRIGDTEGVCIVGEDSMGSGTGDGLTVSYTFTESGVFVPAVYLETNDGTRIWDIKITRP
jgi:hypothetical protein